MAVEYEWVVEAWEDSEVVETEYYATYRDARRAHNADTERGKLVTIALLRDHSDDGRLWAYLTDDGLLPEHFTNSWGQPDCKVPAKYRNEVTRG